MKLYFKKYQLLFFLLLSICSMGNTQTPQDNYYNTEIQERKTKKENWEKTIEGISYDVEPKKEFEDYDEDFSGSASPNAAGNNGSSRSYPYGSSGNGTFWLSVFKFLFIAGVIAAIALLVIHFLGSGKFVSPRNKKIAKSDTTITIENIEDHIYESDMDRFIREATEQSNYALAIRLYYLAIIKELSLSRTIQWKKDKTNKDYLREMRKTKIFQSFREATRIFERVWYGEGELKQSDFQRIKPKFESLVKAAQASNT